MRHEISRRPGSPSDREFLYELLRRSLGPHIEATYGPWDEAWQRKRFLETSDPNEHEIFELEGEAIGCLLIRALPKSLEVLRILLLPEYQNRGIGTEVMREIVSAASRRHTPVRLRVFRVSPAVGFYERLGFRRTGETPTHILMEHTA